MKSINHCITVMMFYLLVVSCALKIDYSKEEEKIRKLLNDWIELGEKGDMKFMEYYADDALWMHRSSIHDKTKEDMYPMYESFLKDYYFDQEITIHEIEICKQWAYVRTTADGWLKPKEGTERDSRRAISRHLTILKKQNDGNWKIYRDIFNNPPPEQE